MTERVAVVGVVGAWSSEQLADAVAERTGFRLIVDMSRVSVDLTHGRALYEGVDLCELDGLIVKKISAEYSPEMIERIELLRYIESCGVAVYSKPERIVRLVDRLACTVTLRSAGIPMPDTVVTEDLEQACEAVLRFERAVLKPLYSTKARGMELIESSERSHVQARVAAFRAAGNKMMYIQRRIPVIERDMGVVFMGGRYVTTYARVRGSDSWNTTVLAGGRYQRHEPEPELIELARRAQAPFDLDFTTVDLVETDAGPMVFEVSAFGGFRGMREGCDIDAAALLANHVLGRLRHAV